MAAELSPPTVSLSPLCVLRPAVTTLALLSVISGRERGERNGEFEHRGGERGRGGGRRSEAIKGDFDSD